jgi:flagellar export protein FliJ
MIKLRVDRIIEIKEKMKEDKERDLEGLKATIRSIIDDIANIDDELQKKHNNMAVAGIDGNEFSALRDYMFHLDARKANLMEKRANMRKVADSLSSECFELAKDMKMLEKLKLKAMRKIKKVEDRREQKILDYIALRIDDNRG